VDSSISHDPFAPDTDPEGNPVTLVNSPEAAFNETRWEQAGATEAQIEDLHVQFDNLHPSEQAAFNEWMKGQSNNDLLAWLNTADLAPWTVERHEQNVAELTEAHENAPKGHRRATAVALRQAEDDLAAARAEAGEPPVVDSEASDATDATDLPSDEGDAPEAILGAVGEDEDPNGGQEPETDEE
jgi:hypothetical protein